MMPTSPGNLVELSTASGVHQSTHTLIPNRAFQLWHGLIHPNTTLTNPEEINIFKDLYSELMPFCGPSAENCLPKTIMDCWEGFSFEVLRGNVYQFKNVVDVALLTQFYSNGTPINNNVCNNHPLTGAVLSTLVSVKSIKAGSKQTIAKITLGYIATAAIELSHITNAVDQDHVVEHLNKVLDILIHEERYRRFFDEEALEALSNLSNQLGKSLATPHPMRDAEAIPHAIQQFSQHQVELVAQLFRLLLILSEGGNKLTLTTDYAKIAKGKLEDGSSSKSFHPDNPFQMLLTEAATFIPSLHQYQRDPISLSLPEKAEIETYLETSLKFGIRILGRVAYGKDPVLYLLEQKKQDNSFKLTWATPEDRKVIQTSASYLYRLADWLRFHLYIADKIVNLKFLLSMEGQRWLAQGEEATFIQHFIHQYDKLLEQFSHEIKALDRYLNQRIRTSMKTDHGVLKFTGVLIERTVTLLKRNGVLPLLNIEAQFLSLASNIATVRRSFFAEMGNFLNNSGYAFELPVNSITNGIPLTVSQVEETREERSENSVSMSASDCEESVPLPLKKIETKARTQLVSDIGRWVATYLDEEVKEQEKNYFLSFWQELCLLKKQSALEEYHTHLFSVRTAREMALFYEQLQSDLTKDNDEVKKGAKDTIHLLKKSMEQPISLNTEIEQLNIIQTSAQNQAEKEKKRFFGLNANKHIAWSNRIYEKLSRKVDVLNEKEPGLMSPHESSSMSSHDFVDAISHCLMQTSSPLDKENLDNYLKDILTLHSLMSDNDTKANYALIARGLMTLGANPLGWMDSQIQKSSLRIPNNKSAGYFLAAEQTKLILSHMENRAKHLGENALFLQDTLKTLFVAVEDFALRLDECVKSDKHWIWRVLALFKKDKPDGARLERAAVYWSILRLIDVILNEELFVMDKFNHAQKSEAYAKALESFAQASKNYSAIAPKKKRFHNMGTATFKQLTTAFETIQVEVENIGKRRLDRAMAIKKAEEQVKKKARLDLKKAYKDTLKQVKETQAVLDRAMNTMLDDSLKNEFGTKNAALYMGGDRKEVFDQKLKHTVSRIGKTFSTYSANQIEAKIITQLQTCPAYSHVKELASNRYRLYSHPTPESPTKKNKPNSVVRALD